MYAFSTNRLLDIEEDDEEISEEVKEKFFKHEQVLKSKLKSKNDRLIMMWGLVYDLYYDYSKERILNEKYIEKMYEHIKNKEIFKPFMVEVIKYLKGE